MAPVSPAKDVSKPKKKATTISKSIARVFRRAKASASGNNSDSSSASTLVASSCPSDASEIEELFLQAIDGLALPKTATDRMHALPLHQKWQIIHEWSAKQGLDTTSEPRTWVQTLHEAIEDISSFSDQDARELHVLMRGSDKEWLTQFHKDDGIAALSDLTGVYAAMDDVDACATRFTECLKCFKSLMNNHVGMHFLLAHPNAVHTLALSLDFDRKERTLMLLEMLSLTCWFSELGHRTVLDAMELLRRRQNERMRYASILDGLATASSVEVQAACLTFINTLVSTCVRVDDRLVVRNDFLALDILPLCQRILSGFESLSAAPLSYGMYGFGDLEIDAMGRFRKQTQVFQGLLRADTDEVVCGALDLSDVRAVLSKLVENASLQGCSDRLLHVALALLVIPNEVAMGHTMWDLVETATLDITSALLPELTEKKRSMVTAVKRCLEQRATPSSEGARLESNQAVLEEAPLAVQTRLNEATATIAQLEAEIERLRTKLLHEASARASTERTSGDTATDASDKLSPTLPEAAAPSETYAKYFKLLKMGMPLEQVQLKAKADGLDPAKLATSAPVTAATLDASYDKYFKLLKMGMPLEQVQLKAKADGLDPAKLAVATPEAPATSVVVDAQYEKYFKLLKMGMPLEQVQLKAKADGLDPAKLSGSATISPPEVKPVPKCTTAAVVAAAPIVPVRAISKLPPKKTPTPSTKMRNLFWTPLPDAVVEGSIWATLDETELSLDWPLLEREFGQEVCAKATKSAAAPSTKVKVVHLVDPKRQQNCSIALTRFRLSPTELCDAILNLNESILIVERVSILEGLVPTSDELDLINSYDGDMQILGETEKWFAAVRHVPRLPQRLQSISNQLSFAARLDDLKAKLSTLEKARSTLHAATPTLLPLLHVVLAVGNYMNNGTARGGAYGFKLEILPKLSQVKATSSARPTQSPLAEVVTAKAPDALAFLSTATCLEAAATVSLPQLLLDATALERSVDLVRQEVVHQPDAAFRRRFGPFVDTSGMALERLRADVSSHETKFAALCARFGFKQPDATGFFGLWHDFGRQLVAAAREFQSSTAATEPEDGAGLFNQFSESLAGDATDIVAKLRKRHAPPSATAAVPNELALKLARRRQSTLKTS
ncbi:hypothetical protein SPRG_14932 [Saprolegnia parasitica CBS 223.65]|uniref:FH2 domain-containing protein n=1 Tax=Saprolegnia parasitica (strain CBS 223.65) TaxID=695850 RepID=A0A067BZ41_SAPPC|nr:hypothetical protein SPRG_14932 [Saprolegnia parasitica CBS 223.65]KDO19832.1 hypothetical protein SPRG_14932 [Saprolegnia parasitica CBS 223.65]|eukprot:XP_012209444.1 hypothetical protein SPRG_14932 [Saprolegnia parasitica CBS 223.65]